jgi:hypothetical protein
MYVSVVRPITYNFLSSDKDSNSGYAFIGLEAIIGLEIR